MTPKRIRHTGYNRFLRVKSRLSSIYAQAVAFRLTHDAIVAKLAADLYQTADYLKLTRYERGYITGLHDGLSADIWRNHVTWMLGPLSGPIRVVHSEWTDEMSRLCRLPGQLYGGHYWTDDDGNPTDRVFTEYKPVNEGASAHV